jgi:hypothetical protein
MKNRAMRTHHSLNKEAPRYAELFVVGGGMSRRAIARALKVDEGTLRKNSAAKPEKPKQNSEGVRTESALPRPAIGGAAAAKTVERAKLGKATGTRGQIVGRKPGSGGRGKGDLSGGTKVRPPDKAPTLKELGLGKRQAARARR